MTAKRTRAFAHHGPLAWSIAILMTGLLVTTAVAHTTGVVASDPANGAVVAKSPASVTAQFDEELDTQQSTMIVVDAGGTQVSDGNGKVDLDDPDHKTMIAAVPAALADGTYTVQWHAMLTDGDASDGTFQFSVSPDAAAVQPAPVENTASQSAVPQTTTNTFLWVTGIVLLIAVVALLIVWRRRRRATGSRNP